MITKRQSRRSPSKYKQLKKDHTDLTGDGDGRDYGRDEKDEFRPIRGKFYQARFAYHPEDAHGQNLLEFEQDEMIIFLDVRDKKYWQGANLQGRVGYFPVHYLRPIDPMRDHELSKRISRTLAHEVVQGAFFQQGRGLHQKYNNICQEASTRTIKDNPKSTKAKHSKNSVQYLQFETLDIYQHAQDKTQYIAALKEQYLVSKARKRERNKKKDTYAHLKHESIIEIQRTVRGKLTRNFLQKQQKAACKIQSLFRGKRDRQRVEDLRNSIAEENGVLLACRDTGTIQGKGGWYYKGGEPRILYNFKVKKDGQWVHMVGPIGKDIVFSCQKKATKEPVILVEAKDGKTPLFITKDFKIAKKAG